MIRSVWALGGTLLGGVATVVYAARVLEEANDGPEALAWVGLFSAVVVVSLWVALSNRRAATHALALAAGAAATAGLISLASVGVLWVGAAALLLVAVVQRRRSVTLPAWTALLVCGAAGPVALAVSGMGA